MKENEDIDITNLELELFLFQNKNIKMMLSIRLKRQHLLQKTCLQLQFYFSLIMNSECYDDSLRLLKQGLAIAIDSHSIEF